jgi:hypothetical protein
MSDTRRIWVIDDGNQPELTSLGDPLGEAPRPAAPTASRRLAPAAVRPAPPVRRPAAPAVSTPRALHRAMHPAAAWALGPIGAALIRGRRRSWRMAAAAAWCALAAATTHGLLLLQAGRADPRAVPWMTLGLGVAAVLGGGLQAWSLRRRLGAADQGGRLRRTWPLPAVLGIGIAVPGAGFAVARRPRRAAAAAGLAWLPGAALLLALVAPAVWRGREAFGSWGLGAADVERMLMAAAIAAILAPLALVAQGLEAMRLQLAADGGGRRRLGGDRVAAALLVVLAVALAAGRPARLGRECGHAAEALVAAGCTESPLLLLRAAGRMDPSRPVYAAAAADLLERRGRMDEAVRLRADLEAALQPVMGAMLRQAAATPPPPPAPEPASVPAPAPRVQAPAPAAAAAPGPEVLLLPTLPLRGPAGPPAPPPAAGP